VKKLKLQLESLEITSFDTVPAGPQVRGTLHAHEAPPSTKPTCPELDCTYHCSNLTYCLDECVLMTERDCA
jgi:hypothetical protein